MSTITVAKLRALQKLGGNGTVITDDDSHYYVELETIDIQEEWLIDTVSFETTDGVGKVLDRHQIIDVVPFIIGESL